MDYFLWTSLIEPQVSSYKKRFLLYPQEFWSFEVLEAYDFIYIFGIFDLLLSSILSYCWCFISILLLIFDLSSYFWTRVRSTNVDQMGNNQMV